MPAVLEVFSFIMFLLSFLLSSSLAAAITVHNSTTVANSATLDLLRNSTSSTSSSGIISSSTRALPSTTSTSSASTPGSSSFAMTSLTSHGVGFFIAVGMGESANSTSANVTTSASLVTGTSLSTHDMISRPRVGSSLESLHSIIASIVADSGFLSSTATSAGTNATLLSINSTATRPSTRSPSLPSSPSRANSTAYPTSGNTVTTTFESYHNQTTAYITETLTNTSWASVSDADGCWSEWKSYWSLHTPAPASIAFTGGSLGKIVLTYLQPSYSYDPSRMVTSTETVTSTLPTVIVNGGFTQTLAPRPVTSTETWTGPVVLSTSTETIFLTLGTVFNDTMVTASASYDAAWPAPSCSMPSLYTGCQDEWEAYASVQALPYPEALPANCPFPMSATKVPDCYSAAYSAANDWYNTVYYGTEEPRCTQASIPGDLCTSLKDAYVLGRNEHLKPLEMNVMPALFSSGSISYIAGRLVTEGWMWPSKQELAPGCTLGCGRCAVTGGSVQLLYFPPGLSHPATGPVVATTLGTTLTSPTYYISFESVYASDACSGVGRTITSTILPMPQSYTLSSLFATTEYCYAHLENNQYLGTTAVGTASFNISDLLQDPVPYSIYTSQPFCASEMFQAGCNPDACQTDAPYQPLLVLESRLLNTLDPAWASCSLDLRGVYDPPKALTPATAVAGPSMTAPHDTPTQPAEPASSLVATTPTPTAVLSISQASTTKAPAPQQSSSESTPKTDPPAASSKHSPVILTNGASDQTADPPIATSAEQMPPPKASVITIGSNTISAALNGGGVVVDGSRIVSAGQATTLQGSNGAVTVSANAQGQAVVQSQGAAQTLAAAPRPATIVVGSNIVAQDPNGRGVVVDGSTTMSVGQRTTLLGANDPVTLSVDPQGQAVVESHGSAQTLAPAPTSPTIIFGSNTIVQGPNGRGAVINGATIGTPGQLATITGTNGPLILSVNPQGGVVAQSQGKAETLAFIPVTAAGRGTIAPGPASGILVIDGGITLSVGQAATVTGASELVTVSRNAQGGILLQSAGGSTTLARGSQGAGAVVLGDHTLVPAGAAMVQNGITLSLPAIAGGVITIPSLAAVGAGGVTIGDQTLLPGGPAVTEGGVTYSMAASDGSVVAAFGGTTRAFAASAIGSPISGAVDSPQQTSALMQAIALLASSALQANGEAAKVTVNGHVYTAFQLSGATWAVIAGTTISEGGPAATIDGEIIRLGASGLSVFDGGQTATIPLSAQATQSETSTPQSDPARLSRPSSTASSDQPLATQISAQTEGPSSSSASGMSERPINALWLLCACVILLSLF